MAFSENDEFEMEVPVYVELKESIFATNDLGAYCRMPLGADQFLGNYKGKIRKHINQIVDQEYYWTIFSSRQIPLFYIDGSDPKDSNWLRFIRTTSDPNKYNVVCMQQNQQINYFTYRDIKPGEELVSYLPGKKKKGKHKTCQSPTYRIASNEPSTSQESVVKKPNNEKTSDLKLKTIEESVEPTDKATADSKSDKKASNDPVAKVSESSTTSVSTRSSKQAIKSELQTRAHQSKNHKSISTVVKFELVSKDTNEENLYAIDFNLILKKPPDSSVTELKRQLVCCDMCTFALIIDPDTISANGSYYLSFMKNHILNKHLTTELENNENEEENEENLEKAVSQVMESMLKKIDSDTPSCFYYRCCMNMNKCGQAFQTRQQLRKHLDKAHTTQIEKISCFYCAKLFNCITNRQINDFFDHLKNDHNELVKESLLLDVGSILSATEDPKRSEEELESMFNWTDHFASSDSEQANEDQDDNNTQDDSDRENNTNAQNNNNNKNEDDEENESSEESEAAAQNELLDDANSKSRTFTCQMCKKQFEQRGDMLKHQCLEAALKLMRKKKEIRKKKWREAHWKRKIDLSYIESTSLTQLSKNIADNLSFCIDGTQEDLKAYSREVKDYLSSELGYETELEMLLKCCFSDFYNQFLANDASNQSIDSIIGRKANNYFINNSNSNDAKLTCKLCKNKFHKPIDLVQHLREVHKQSVITSFDLFQLTQCNEHKPITTTPISISPIGYLNCDPTAYLINLHWDKELKKKCANCSHVYSRPAYKNHVNSCQSSREKESDPSEENVEEKVVVVQEKEVIEEIVIKEKIESEYEVALSILNGIIDSIEKEPKLCSVLQENVETLPSDNIQGEVKNEHIDQEPRKIIVKTEEPTDNRTKESENKTNQIGETTLSTSEEPTEIDESESLEEEKNEASSSKRRPKRSAHELLDENNSVAQAKKRNITTPSSSQSDILLPPEQPATPTRSSRLSIKKEEEQPTMMTNNTRQSPRLLRSTKSTSESSSENVTAKTPEKTLATSTFPALSEPGMETPKSSSSKAKFNFVTVRTLSNGRKLHTCDKCGLEFTSPNSVIRHQEKSCLRVKVISVPVFKNGEEQGCKKKCPICSSTFFNTHRLSIHIYKHHKNLLGSVHSAPSGEAQRLHEMQLKKLQQASSEENNDIVEDDEFYDDLESESFEESFESDNLSKGEEEVSSSGNGKSPSAKPASMKSK